ncbi:MAG: 2,3,4,5-tetrahydropyridine-2,6-dicarboxylate N-succinyltransferase, partial [Novosphingobium sp.]|nr:2,3,4,5-tetrahydropyridine-2,6-dicarboxylate N-succinyltransferase [Novosphingobium sp.]
MSELEAAIEAAWERRESVTPASSDIRAIVEQVLELLDSGRARVAEPDGQGGWKVNQWLKKAVLLSFRLADNAVMELGSAGAPAFDKVPLKFSGWDESRFREAGIRVVPGAIVRRSAFIARGAVLMPSFVNLGAYVGEGTMIDTWATVGSCAQIGRNVHISGGAGIGGVLEPLQANPVVIEDNCFIGARSEVAEGVIAV